MSEQMMTPLQEASVYLHEMYVALIEAGFDEDQALYLVSMMMED